MDINAAPALPAARTEKNHAAWGAVKVMLAFSKLPVAKRTPLINDAINYPTRTDSKPSRDWWKFGFPVFYVTDLLQNVEALVGLGYGRDPRLTNAIELIREKQDADGRWPLEYDYAGKTCGDYGTLKAPNKWVTLRALRVLKAI